MKPWRRAVGAGCRAIGWLLAAAVIAVLSDELAARLLELDLGEARGRPEGPTAAPATEVGLSIAVHPPKFAFVARFLAQWHGCPPARDAISIVVVFSSEADRATFARGLANLAPELPASSWTAVVGAPPAYVQGDQRISAWKKWYGITHMMDLGPRAPTYGLMVDAELLLYNESDCGNGSAWTRWLERVRALEASKAFPAAQIDDQVQYDFGHGMVKTGKWYDRAILQKSFSFLKTMLGGKCNLTRCALVQEGMIDKVLYSWWTDVPYMNLRVASSLLRTASKAYERGHRAQSVVGPLAGPGPILRHAWASRLPDWMLVPLQHRNLLQLVEFPQFEILLYHQWCILFEGFSIRDVTEITGPAGWGSYNEEPRDGARIAELTPLWISSTVYLRARNGRIPPMSAEDPPLLIFHVDHEGHAFQVGEWNAKWREAVKAD